MLRRLRKECGGWLKCHSLLGRLQGRVEEKICVSIMFNLYGNSLCPGSMFSCVETSRVMLNAFSPIPALMPSWGKSNLSDH